MAFIGVYEIVTKKACHRTQVQHTLWQRRKLDSIIKWLAFISLYFLPFPLRNILYIELHVTLNECQAEVMLDIFCMRTFQLISINGIFGSRIVSISLIENSKNIPNQIV